MILDFRISACENTTHTLHYVTEKSIGSLILAWWRHQMDAFCALLSFCAGIHWSPVNSPHKSQWRGVCQTSDVSKATTASYVQRKYCVLPCPIRETNVRLIKIKLIPFTSRLLFPEAYSTSQEKCTRFLLCCALLWLYIDWFSHIHQAYFTGAVAI